MSPFRILILSIVMIALALSLAACGSSSGGGAQQVVDEATLKGIESGNIDLRGEIDVKGEKRSHLAFQLSGPFQSKAKAESSEFDLSAGAKGSVGGEKVDFEGGLTVLPNKAYVEFEGTDYKVDATTYGFAKEIAGESEEVSSCQEAVSDRQLSEFIEDPSDEGKAKVAGTSTTKIGGDVDAETAIDALIEMNEDALCNEQLKAVPGYPPALSELKESGDEAQNLIKDAHLELYIGNDHIVRRIVAQVPTIELPREAGGNGSPESLGLEFDLTLSAVNEDQTISAPQHSKPLRALFIKLGINPVELPGLLLGGVGGLTGLLERIAGSTQ